MKPFPIIHIFDEVGNPSENVIQGLVLPEVDLLGLEGFHEAFGKGIVVRVALPGHADLELGVPEFVDVIMSRVLHAPVRVMNHPRRRISVLDGHTKRLEAQRRVDLARNGIADDFP